MGAELARMIIRRIQAVAPALAHKQCEKNERNVEDSSHYDTHIQTNQLKMVRHEEHNGHEHAEKHLRRIFPCNTKL
jgi:hypothetical protein